MTRFTVELFAWTNSATGPPEWITDANGKMIDGFSVVCEIIADLSGMQASLKKNTGSSGTYYELEFDLCLELGGTEIKAYLEWNEKV
ncbi:heat shock protein 70 kDa 12A [Ceratobasidium sp. AG-Ba]|nr:heat shock protein 70 kDa 12A [Ceratobasidium sp. AG-Ba]QRW04510.1 heat shock protein 70 kDa 12A [Ceratobasidium sp. AG-Ba]